MKALQKWFKTQVGFPRVFLSVFLIAMIMVGSFAGVSAPGAISDVINRVGMNGILVLSMVPMIQGGCGLNFGIPLGLIAGIFGAITSLEFHLSGLVGIFSAIAIAVVTAVVIGYLYSIIINRVKGDEMIIATYVGFAFIYLMNLFWVSFPFKNPASVQGYTGEGLRTTISLDNYWISVFSNFLKIKVGKLVIPTGMLLVFALMCLLVWIFLKTKTGTAVTAVGSNPDYARASGINIDKMRTIATILSTVIAAVGMVVYQQSFGYIQTYTAPLAFTFPTVAAVLLGGASINKSSITNVILGTILFQGILTMAPKVINVLIDIDASDLLRIIITNGMILFALTRKVDN